MADTKEEKTVRLEVRSRNDRGFRREGRLWTPDPVEDSFTEEAAQRLEQEPQLITRRLDGSKASTAAGATGAGSPNISDLQPSGVRSGTPATDATPAHPAGNQPSQPARFTEDEKSHEPAKRR